MTARSNGLERNRPLGAESLDRCAKVSSMETAIDRASMLAAVDVVAVNVAQVQLVAEAKSFGVPKEQHDAERR